MRLTNNNQPYEYLFLLQPDGIGTQFIYINRLLGYAMKTDCKLIVDFRKMAFFMGWGVSCEGSELNKVLCFDTDRIIYDPEEIDKILNERSSEVLATRFCKENFDPTGLTLPFVWAGDLLPAIDFGDSSHCLKDKLKLVGEYEIIFNSHRASVASCVGVHARLGNGEQHSGPDKLRMKTAWNRFFSAMDEHRDDSFFVCTDTPSFLEACMDKYGDRVVVLDRFRPPENCGPGHNTWSVYDEEKKDDYIRERNRVGPYRVLGEALVEMFLLGVCKRLICNQSSFTHYARACCNVDALVLK